MNKHCEHIEYEDGQPKCEACDLLLCEDCRVRIDDLTVCLGCALCACGKPGITFCYAGCGAAVCADCLQKSAEETMCKECVAKRDNLEMVRLEEATDARETAIHEDELALYRYRQVEGYFWSEVC